METIEKVKERPILFSTPMVRAILEGRKTVTRRVVSDQSAIGDLIEFYQPSPEQEMKIQYSNWADEDDGGIKGPEWIAYFDSECCFPLGQGYGQAGEVLWVRETFYAYGYWSLIDGRWEFNDSTLQYDGYRFMDNPPFEINTSRNQGIGWYKRPSIFMPRQACRLRIEILSIRVERLHDITEEDAIREGLSIISKDGGRTYKYGIPDNDGLPGTDDNGWPWTDWNTFATEAFFTLWRKINGDESFQANPWVWRIEFRKLEDARTENTGTD